MNTGRALLGSVFVAVGVLVLLEQLGVLDAGEVIADWWPVVLLGAAVLDLLARPPRRVSATVFGVLGVVLLAITTDVVSADVWELVWPLAIVGVGLWLVFRRPGPREGTASPDEIVDVVVLFSGRRVVNTAPRFRGGSATAVFGGHESHVPPPVTADAPTLRVRATAIFGGVDVKIGKEAPLVSPPPAAAV